VPAAVLEHRYEHRGAASEALRRRDPEVLLSGPAGTGKSRGVLEKLNLVALKYPGARILIVRQTAISLTSTALVTWEEHVVPEGLRAGLLSFFGGSPREPASYRYRNGSRVVVGGMDNPDKIMSSEYDVAYVQEAIELTVTGWEAINTRLRNGRLPYQQLIADTNPSFPMHWLKRRCDDGKTVLLESRHRDNPVYYALNADGSYTLTERGAAYMQRLDALTGPRRYRLRDGLWVGAEGLIYEDYDPAVHLIDRFIVPPEWPRIEAVDFGYTNPFVWHHWAVDPDGRMILVAELYRTQRLVEDHAKDILAVRERLELPRPYALVCDHDAEDRATLERHVGMSTTAARKGVSDGIQAFQARLRPAGDGRPRAYLFKDSLVEVDPLLVDVVKPVRTADEFLSYRWDIRPDKPPKEEPVKEDDHGLDTARYAGAQLDLGGRFRMRWV
jgi:PBSX family phage terminase large subunit